MSKEESLNKLITVLETIRSKITPDCDVVWSRYHKPQEVIDLINGYISSIQKNDLSVLGNINLDFGSTSTFQEISISNGWGYQFLELSKDFDAIYQKLR